MTKSCHYVKSSDTPLPGERGSNLGVWDMSPVYMTWELMTCHPHGLCLNTMAMDSAMPGGLGGECAKWAGILFSA